MQKMPLSLYGQDSYNIYNDNTLSITAFYIIQEVAFMKFMKASYFFICFLMLFATTASAYIDPASSTYILQIIAGVFIAGGITMGIYWQKIKRFFRKTFKKNSQK